MTRKHYVAIAAALRGDAAHAPDFSYARATQYERGAYDQWSTTVLAVSRVLAADNPRFDRGRFELAAGMR